MIPTQTDESSPPMAFSSLGANPTRSITLKRPTVLVTVRYFVPAYKAGGPLRTLKAMVEQLSGAYQFRIVALDRDVGDHRPFPLIRSNEWNQQGLAEVLYLSPGLLLPGRLMAALRSTEFGILYLNSFFDPVFTLLPLLARRLGLLRGKPVVLAPRGEISPGALAQGQLKKRVFLKVAGLLSLYRDTVLHASTDLEKSEIERTLGRGAGDSTYALSRPDGQLRIRVARDLALSVRHTANSIRSKRSGQLNAIFLSRVSPKKNLVAAIEMLSQVRGDVSLDIYGAIDDSSYWQQCKRFIAQSGTPLRVQYKGALAHERVSDTFAQYDAFVFPTLGENFGHVILESLLAGCPVLISDQTPWRELEAKRAGWDLPLSAPERFIEVLQVLADMGEESHRLWREGAKALGRATLNDEKVLDDNKQLFSNLRVR
jgi:glycosyltransferase involved in cell wall biosynthesis